MKTRKEAAKEWFADDEHNHVSDSYKAHLDGQLVGEARVLELLRMKGDNESTGSVPGFTWADWLETNLKEMK